MRVLVRLLGCLMITDALWPWCSSTAGTIHPYYQRRLPAPQKEDDFASDSFHIDLRAAQVDLSSPFVRDPVGVANEMFDKRAAAAIRDFIPINWNVNCTDDPAKNVTMFGPRILPMVEWREVSEDIKLPFGLDECGRVYGFLKFSGGGLSTGRDLLEWTWYGIDPFSLCRSALPMGKPGLGHEAPTGSTCVSMGTPSRWPPGPIWVRPLRKMGSR